MRDHEPQPAAVSLSILFYGWLLAAYPSSFRAEYGFHMVQAFGDVCRRDHAQGGLMGLAALWARTSLDWMRTTAEQHLERGINMNRKQFVSWSGWALVAGGILFASGLILGNLDSEWSDPIGGVDAFYEISQVVGIASGQVLFVLGLLGLRAGFAERSGDVGRWALLASVAGGVVSLAGMLVMNNSELGWGAWVSGLLTMTLALVLYGFLSIRRSVFSRWNFAPLLAGAPLPLVFALGLAIEAAGGTLGEWAVVSGVAATSVGMILLGTRVRAEAGQAVDVAAA